MEVRRAAIDGLGGHAGTVVVMDPRSGRIFSVVNQDWAIRRAWRPASMMKLVTALAAVREGVIDPAQKLRVADLSFRVDLADALALSNNGYFSSAGTRVGAERLINYARLLGLGEATGVNYDGEVRGRVPGLTEGANAGRLGTHGDNIEVTPIQLAALIAALGNGGTLLKPRVPNSQHEARRFAPEVRGRLDISADVLARLVAGMEAAVDRGTGSSAKGSAARLAGKTGSMQAKDSSLGIFGSFAPANDPQLLVLVLTRGKDETGRVAASVAGKIYRALGQRL